MKREEILELMKAKDAEIQALEYAVQLPRFHTYGTGGKIKPIKIVGLGD